MLNLERFNLPINVRDFIDYHGNSKHVTRLFSLLMATVTTNKLTATYVVYSGGKFQIRTRPLVHVWAKDVIERYYEMYDKAKDDLKINLDIWDQIIMVVRKVLEEEYRAYRSEKG